MYVYCIDCTKFQFLKNLKVGPKAQPSGGSKNFIGFSFLVFHNSHLVVKYAKSVENVWGSKKNLSKPAPIVAPNVDAVGRD